MGNQAVDHKIDLLSCMHIVLRTIKFVLKMFIFYVYFLKRLCFANMVQKCNMLAKNKHLFG